jgi:hypothetical protein
MLKEIRESNDPISLGDISKFEKRWNLLLPESYRSFLLKHNGGKPVPRDFPIEGMENNPIGRIQEFFGLKTLIPTDDLSWIFENLGVPQPVGLLPIARTEGIDFVCISTKEEGRILFWDRMACWGKDNWSANDFYPVAEDFDDLIFKLHEAVPENESEPERILRTDDFDGLVRLLDSGYPLETTDEYGRTLIENAAINGRPAMIWLLFDRGAKLRSALQLAEQNLEFFPKHKETVDILRKLSGNVRNQ